MRRLIKFLWRPAVAFWGTIGLLVLYLLSVGPAAWMSWNLPLPEWLASGIAYLYCPLNPLDENSATVAEAFAMYVDIWVDYDVPPSTIYAFRYDPPPFFIEVSGTVIGAWLIWNFVRWMNQRKTLKLDGPAPQVAP
jgi:hypothetical protein